MKKFDLGVVGKTEIPQYKDFGESKGEFKRARSYADVVIGKGY